MLKYIDIAVDLKLHRHAKDGLHQYRNISQQQAPQSLEAIIQHLLKAGESRVAKAAKEARSMNSARARPSRTGVRADAGSDYVEHDD